MFLRKGDELCDLLSVGASTRGIVWVTEIDKIAILPSLVLENIQQKRKGKAEVTLARLKSGKNSFSGLHGM